METITSAQFVEPIAKRIVELSTATSDVLLSSADKTNAELHYARGKISGLQACLAIIDSENKKFSEMFHAKTNMMPEEEVAAEALSIAEAVNV